MKKALLIISLLILIPAASFAGVKISYRPAVGLDFTSGGESNNNLDLEISPLTMRVGDNMLSIPMRVGLNMGSYNGASYSALNLQATLRYEYIFPFALTLGGEAGWGINLLAPTGNNNYLFMDAIIGVKEFNDALSMTVKGGIEWAVGKSTPSWNVGVSLLYYIGSPDKAGEQSESAALNNALDAESYMDDAYEYTDPYQDYFGPIDTPYEIPSYTNPDNPLG